MHKFYVHFSAFTISLSIDVELFLDNYCIINNYFLWLRATQLFMNVNVLETRNGQFPPKQKLECKITLKFPSYKWQNDESKHTSSSHRTLIIDEISYVAQIWNRTSGSVECSLFFKIFPLFCNSTRMRLECFT